MASVIHYTIATEAEKSPDFRRVLWTGEHTQLVIMTIPPDGEIGEEVHEVDQILTFVSGTGQAIVSGQKKNVAQGDLVVVPAGKKHNFLNTGVTRWCCTPSTGRRSTPTRRCTRPRSRPTSWRRPARTNRRPPADRSRAGCRRDDATGHLRPGHSRALLPGAR